ncbi:MAG: SDR family oxidoreductase [Eubacteriales bacterium]|jgi:NAD(P)-dependent dehydrogenase (short-subunit alcohol dehydrogenase family)|nr:SDR family oxidoreductase [Eubacteriales bacterium]
MFKNKIAVVTGGARGIGKTICERFKSEGAEVCVVDKLQNEYFTGDISEEKTLCLFADKVIAQYGKIDFLINNACLSLGGLEDCSYDDFNYVLRTGITAPFMLTKLFMNNFTPGACIINISSSRDRMSQPNTESYSSAKGGISALTHALAVSLSGKVRVNSISPGWIDTSGSEFEKADKAQHPAGRIGKPEDIAETVLFLCSERAGFITGENIAVDGGMTKMMIYHNDYGWKYEVK